MVPGNVSSIRHLMSEVIDLNACVCVRVSARACVPFSTFQRAASTYPFESFYELHLFLIANFTERIGRKTIGTLV